MSRFPLLFSLALDYRTLAESLARLSRLVDALERATRQHIDWPRLRKYGLDHYRKHHARKAHPAIKPNRRRTHRRAR